MLDVMSMYVKIVTIAPGLPYLLARDTDYLALRDSQRPLNETTGLVAADLIRFALL